jgi:hypothetical protein
MLLTITLQSRSSTPNQPLSMMLWPPPLSKPSTFILSILTLFGSLSLYTIPALPNIQKLLNQVQLNPLLLAPRIPKPQFSTLNKPSAYPATPKTFFKSPTTPQDPKYKCWNCKQPGHFTNQCPFRITEIDAKHYLDDNVINFNEINTPFSYLYLPPHKRLKNKKLSQGCKVTQNGPSTVVATADLHDALNEYKVKQNSPSTVVATADSHLTKLFFYDISQQYLSH